MVVEWMKEFNKKAGKDELIYGDCKKGECERCVFNLNNGGHCVGSG